MKQVLFLILVFLFSFTSCKKDASNPIDANTVPATPTLATPEDTASNIAEPVILTWNESSGAKSYTLQVSASSSFSSFVFNKNDITTTTQQIPELNYLAVYYWRVNASNSTGTSDWSKVWSFNTTGEAGLVPQLSLPANGVVDQKLSPVLVWNKVSNANSYTLQVATSSSFTSFIFNADTLTTTSKQISDLSGVAKYYWRVSTTNNYGTKGWSETWSFTTGVAPVPPVLLSPSDGATDISLSPILSWNASSGATTYTLQISTYSSFTSYIFNQSVGNVISKQVSGLNALTKYYWRINSLNSFGNSNWSDIRSFTTQSVCVGTETILYDNKTYHTVAIDKQCWLKENLDIGTMIQGNAKPSNNGTIEKYCFDNNAANCITYGGLYQWNEAMQYVTTEKAKGICPTGWHIPTKAELETLMVSVGNDGNKLKREDQGTGWGIGTNTSGFSALLAGFRDTNGAFSNLGNLAFFWSSTQGGATGAFNVDLWADGGGINMYGGLKELGYGIRCLQD